ncbi:conserved hypothetical protein [Hyella patelloides LEGE 07179]|uniref:Uncharacterized protein n=1 Tax=Hyella patelloides LEGE 07179 TaxID=945734 RepID=A0A563W5E6_9CYAN|nr:chromosome segregation protein SMC [Hyella patelloides]VEP18922.1 conserved hypothetical protein [Hyella patelloides LEGE 07179]
MENISDYLTSIQQETVAEEKTVKVAKLIILLIKIEKELNTVKSTLLKLQTHQRKYKKDSSLAEQITRKINTVEQLLEKIRKARLNLNFYFI